MHERINTDQAENNTSEQEGIRMNIFHYGLTEPAAETPDQKRERKNHEYVMESATAMKEWQVTQLDAIHAAFDQAAIPTEPIATSMQEKAVQEPKQRDIIPAIPVFVATAIPVEV